MYRELGMLRYGRRRLVAQPGGLTLGVRSQYIALWSFHTSLPSCTTVLGMLHYGPYGRGLGGYEHRRRAISLLLVFLNVFDATRIVCGAGSM